LFFLAKPWGSAARPPKTPEAFFAYINERELIRLRRESGAAPPWTSDPILQTYRFCSVFREHDKVTRWIRENWREPFADHPNLWLGMCLARLLNNIMALDTVGYPLDWRPYRTLEALQALEARGTTIWSPSYRRCIPRAGSRTAHCVRVIDGLHRDPPAIDRARTLEDAFGMLRGRPGLGSFLSYQIVVDLAHTRYLRNAADRAHWAVAGPGAIRGLNRLHGRAVDHPLPPDQALREMRELRALAPQYLGAHVQPELEVMDIQHNACEVDKLLRIRAGVGVGRRYVWNAEPGDPTPPRCSECAKPIAGGRILTVGPIALQEDCLAKWRRRSALPLF
jgi:hypothetical protein